MPEQLRIGGVTLSCTNGFVDAVTRKPNKKRSRQTRKGRKAARRVTPKDGSDTDKDLLVDYVNNLLQDGSDGDADLVEQSADGIENDSKLTGIAVPAFARTEILSLTDDDIVYSSPDSSLADSEGSEDGSGDVSISDIAEDMADRLILEAHGIEFSSGELSPSVVKDVRSHKIGIAQESSSHSTQEPLSSQDPKSRAALREVKRRQKQLRKANAERQSTNLGALNRQLHDFVAQRRDVEILPSIPKANVRPVQRLAALYNLHATPCQARRNRVYILVRATRKTGLPQPREAISKIAALLAEFEGASPAPRKVGSRHGRQEKGKITKSQGEGRKYQQPTLFVSSGHLNDTEPDYIVTLGAMTRLQQEARGDKEPPSTDRADVGRLGTSPGQANGAHGREVLSLLEEGEMPTLGLGNPTAEAAPQHLKDLDAGPPGLGLRPCPSQARDSRQCGSSSSLVEAIGNSALLPSSLAVDTSEGVHAGHGREAYFKLLEERTKPSVLRTKAQCKKARRKLEKEQRRNARQQGEEAPAQPQQLGPQYGDFERYTSGIGSKLLAQMGFEGKGSGLGRESQGIAEPLRAVPRPKKLGLGA